MSKSKEGMFSAPLAPKNERQLHATDERNRREDEIEIALRAYELWQERGCPEGSAEEDWIQAEREVKSKEVDVAA